MQKLLYMKEGYVDDLKKSISDNQHFYLEDQPWLDKFFKAGSWCLFSNINMPDLELVPLKKGGNKAENDLINSKILFNGLRELTLTQASDERLWVALSHTIFWKYMRSRWPTEEYTVENIRERYFLTTNRSRALVRNGISRLWWYGYTAYDDSRADPFELTQILCKTTDTAASLTERAFSHCKRTAINLLSYLKERDDAGETFLERDKYRELMKFVNQTGGMAVIDAFEKADLDCIMSTKISHMMKAV